MSTHDFWPSSGFDLLERTPTGALVVTDAYLRAYLSRPELAPVEESNDAERALHRALLAEPRKPVEGAELDALGDADAIENYRLVLDFRDHLLAHETLEAAYSAFFRRDGPTVPPIFLDQMVQVIVRALLAGGEDALRARAAELLFRAQRVSPQDSGILLADAETVELHAETGGLGSLGRLLVASDTRPRQVALDVLNEDNADIYWARSDRFDTVIDVAFTRPALDALCRVLELWVRHMTGAAVQITPVQSIRDERWTWHVGLDATASAILNDLYEGREVDEARMQRLIALFRLEFHDRSMMLERVAGRPVYLGMAMDERSVLRMKPQNLLVNLPLANVS